MSRSAMPRKKAVPDCVAELIGKRVRRDCRGRPSLAVHDDERRLGPRRRTPTPTQAGVSSIPSREDEDRSVRALFPVEVRGPGAPDHLEAFRQVVVDASLDPQPDRFGQVIGSLDADIVHKDERSGVGIEPFCQGRRRGRVGQAGDRAFVAFVGDHLVDRLPQLRRQGRITRGDQRTEGHAHKRNRVTHGRFPSFLVHRLSLRSSRLVG